MNVLTPGQVNHFRTFGFLVLRQLLTPDEAAAMKHESEEIMSELRGGKPVDPKNRQPVQPFFERRPFLRQVVEDDRIYGLAEDLLGEDFTLCGTEGNLHVGDTPWHGGNGDQTDLILIAKVCFYLDPVRKETGCLRVIPGSQRAYDPDPYSTLREGNREADFRPFGVLPSEIPSIPLESDPGDVVVFTEDLLHAAFGGSVGRHQHAISYMENPKTEKQEDHIRALSSSYKYALHPARSFIESDRPRLRRLVSRLMELGCESYDV
jgi:hypothetical protein